MKKNTEEIIEPQTHLSRTETGWCVIHQGMPLCRENATYAEATATAERYKVKLSTHVWLSMLGAWGTLAEAKAL